MRIEVLYFAEFKDTAGKHKEVFQLNGGTVGHLINMLIEKYPSFRELLLEPNKQKIHSNISIVINKSPLHDPNPRLAKLSEGDTVAFLLPVSGG
ncbi:MAG: ThiS family protein [Promethearchaeota archaeon]|nr:MAG: ThiS family protein [Candidatus Lokiarchaeota archaeon]